MKPYNHAVSSARQFGGKLEDYLEIHDWFDQTKSHFGDNRHRAILHTSFGIFLCEQVFGHNIVNSAGKQVSVRDIGEQHVVEDMKCIPNIADYLSSMTYEPWMHGEGLPPSQEKLKVYTSEAPADVHLQPLDRIIREKGDNPPIDYSKMHIIDGSLLYDPKQKFDVVDLVGDSQVTGQVVIQQPSGIDWNDPKFNVVLDGSNLSLPPEMYVDGSRMDLPTVQEFVEEKREEVGEIGEEPTKPVKHVGPIMYDGNLGGADFSRKTRRD